MQRGALNKTPNTKHQAPEKTQTSSSKVGAEFEGRADVMVSHRTEAASYMEAAPECWVLKEGGQTGDAGLHPFDLEERTARFGEAVVRLSRKIPRDPTNNRLIDQFVGCGTSIGANYCEANGSVSAKDFRFSVSRCVKEAKETKFFLRMLAASETKLAEEARPLYREAHELQLIFASMFRKGQT